MYVNVSGSSGRLEEMEDQVRRVSSRGIETYRKKRPMGGGSQTDAGCRIRTSALFAPLYARIFQDMGALYRFSL